MLNSADGEDAAARPSLPSKAVVPRIWGEIPARNLLFTGREKLLAELHDQLVSQATAAVLPPSESGRETVPRALHGLPGVGKTQVAVEYAHRYQSEYDIVWWISADQAYLIRGSIAALASHLELTSTADANVGATASAVLDHLRRGDPSGNWLLIFDNADRPEDLDGFLLTDGPGHTIVTSRNPAWRDVVKTLTVGVFTKTESRVFLRKHLPRIGNADSDSLAEALGRLPLALQQAGALQARSGMTVREYLKLLDSQADLVLGQAKPIDYPVSATAALAASFTKLTAENPQAIDLLRCCAFFGPEPIPRDVLSEGRGTVKGPLDILFNDPLRFNHAILDLGRYSLAQVDLRDRTLQVHRVIQAIVRNALSTEQRRQFRHDVHLLLAAATPADSDNSSAWPRYRELLAHYDPAGVVECRSAKVRHRVRGIIRYQYMIGDFDAAYDMASRTLKQWSNDPDSQPADLLAVKRHLGDILRASGRYSEAYQLGVATIGEATTQLGPADDQTLRVTNSHGANLRAAGEFSAAYALDAETVRRSKRAFTAPDRRILRAQNNLAVDMVLLGRYQEAAKLHQEVYQEGRSVYGRDNHPSVLVSRINYACAIRLSGRYADACLMAEDTYAACRKALYAGHPIFIFAATDLAIALRKELGGAETLERITSLLKRHGKLRGEKNPDAIAAIMAQANTLRAAGDLNRAISLTEWALAAYQEVFSPTHPYALGCSASLAVLRRLSGNPQAARELDESALLGLTSVLGPDHPYTLGCALGLASDLAALGETAVAREQGDELVTRLRAVLTAAHPVTSAATINLASDLMELGQNDAAEAMRSAALAALEMALGPDHPDLLAGLANRRLETDFDPPPT